MDNLLQLQHMLFKSITHVVEKLEDASLPINK